MTETNTKTKRSGRRLGGFVKFPGLMNAAAEIQCHPGHLIRCLECGANPAHVAAKLRDKGHPLAAQAQAAVEIWNAKHAS